jgi:hypothetical protein
LFGGQSQKGRNEIAMKKAKAAKKAKKGLKKGKKLEATKPLVTLKRGYTGD